MHDPAGAPEVLDAIYYLPRMHALAESQLCTLSEILYAFYNYEVRVSRDYVYSAGAFLCMRTACGTIERFICHLYSLTSSLQAWRCPAT